MIPNFTAEAALPTGNQTYRASAVRRAGSLNVFAQQYGRTNSTLARGSLNEGLEQDSDCGTIRCPGCQTCHDRLICC